MHSLFVSRLPRPSPRSLLALGTLAIVAALWLAIRGWDSDKRTDATDEQRISLAAGGQTTTRSDSANATGQPVTTRPPTDHSGDREDSNAQRLHPPTGSGPAAAGSTVTANLSRGRHAPSGDVAHGPHSPEGHQDPVGSKAALDRHKEEALPVLTKNLAISGRVLNEAGLPTSGIELIATAVRLFDLPDRVPIPVSELYLKTVSASDGRYAFEPIADGEYRIRTVATAHYPGEQVYVRAGADFADLVLSGQHALNVSGIVTAASGRQVGKTEGEPLERVRVAPTFLGARGAYSDANGNYALQLSLKENSPRTFSIRAELEGFREQVIRVDETDLNSHQAIPLNIALEPVATVTVVAGAVKGGNGNTALAGGSVKLQSKRLRQTYRARTSPDGRFTIMGVEPGEDYRLMVRGGGHQDYLQQNLTVTLDGLNLELVLEPERNGRLSGQLQDLHGTPIPNFSLTLRSQNPPHRAMQVTTDASGNYFVQDAPTGRLVFESQSSPRFVISGIEVSPSGDVQVPVVLDWGDNQLRGLVVDGQGNPVPVPEIVLSWSHVQNGVRSSSTRHAAADAQGYFVFDQLGPGRHTVFINVPGFKQAQVEHDVTMQGFEFVVRLEAKI